MRKGLCQLCPHIAGSGEVLFHAKIEVFWISMATVREFPNSENFSAVPVSSPLNRAVNQVFRSDGRAGRALVRIAPYILDKLSRLTFFPLFAAVFS